MGLGRRKARMIALEALYQLDISDGDVREVIDAYLEGKDLRKDVKEFVLRLINGVCEHKKEIDRHISKNAENWSLNRIAVIDRNILRLAVSELLYCPDVPCKVVIDEAVEIGKRYGSEDSGAFINGVLDKIARGVPLRKEEVNPHPPAPKILV